MGKVRKCPCGREPNFYRSKKGVQYICISPKCYIPQTEPQKTIEDAERTWNERCAKWEK